MLKLHRMPRTRRGNPRLRMFLRQIQEGRTLYANKEKAAAFFDSIGLQLPKGEKELNSFFINSIKTETDLVNARKENSMLYQQDTADNTCTPRTRGGNPEPAENTTQLMRRGSALHDVGLKAFSYPLMHLSACVDIPGLEGLCPRLAGHAAVFQQGIKILVDLLRGGAIKDGLPHTLYEEVTCFVDDGGSISTLEKADDIFTALLLWAEGAFDL